MSRRRAQIAAALLASVVGAFALLARGPAGGERALPAAGARSVAAATTVRPVPVVPLRAQATAAPPGAEAVVDAGLGLTVRVTRRDGSPVAGARCDLVRRNPWMEPAAETAATAVPREEPAAPLLSETTGADGTAAIRGLAAGFYRVSVHADGLQRAEADAKCVAGGGPEVVSISLDPALEMGGAVRDGRGAPIAGARVVVLPPPGSKGPASETWTFRATLDAAGAWRVAGLRPGTWDVWVWREGRGYLRDGSVRVPGVTRHDLVLTDGAVLRGTVTDDGTGTPVAGARVTLWSNDWEPFAELVGEGVSDDEGRYVVRTYRPSARVEKLTVVAAGRARLTETNELVLEDTVPAERDFRLVPECRVEGLVRGPDGPVSGARVRVWTTGTGPFGEAEERTFTAGADGRYVVGSLTPGPLVLFATARGLVDPRCGRERFFGGPSLDSFPETARLELRAGEVRTLGLTLAPADDPDAVTLRISGTVLLPDGTPAAGAEVWTSAYGAGNARGLWLARVTSGIAGADGTFALDVTGTPGNFGIQARAPKCDTIERKFLEDAPTDHDGIVLRLERLPFVRGRVLSDGAPVPAASVRLGQRTSGRGGEYTNWKAPVPAGLDGSYEILVRDNDWPRGGIVMEWGEDDYVVCASAEGCAPAISAPFHAADTAEGLTLDLRLDADAELRGRIVDSHLKEPVAGVKLFVQPARSGDPYAWPPRYGPDERGAVAALSDADGRYVLRGLQPGTYQLGFERDGFSPEEREARAPGALDVEVVPALDVRGIVVGPGGLGVAGVVVELRDPATDIALWASPRITGSDGRFRFAAVRDGRYRLEAVPTGDGESLAPAELDVAAGDADVRVPLVAASVVSGRLLDADGAPVPNQGLSVRGQSGGPREYATGFTDASGRFVVKHTVPGTYTVAFGDVGLAFEGVLAGVPTDLRYPGTLTAGGHLVDPDGKPVVTGIVDLFEARARTASAGPRVVHLCGPGKGGVFTFRHLAPGEYDAETSASWLLTLSRDERRHRVLRQGTPVVAGEDLGTVTAVPADHR